MRRSTLPRPLRLLTAVALSGALTVGASVALAADQPLMGTAANYAVMGATAITNTGPTVINGNLAISPNGSTSVTGFLPGVVNGTMDMGNSNASDAQTALITAYTGAANEPSNVDLTGQNLGGLTLTPGTYTFSSSAQLTGTLTLDGQGSTNAVFIFQIGSTLTTASNASVQLINGAGACAVYWQVGSSATLGTTTDFQGTIMALTSITMNTGATIGVGGLGYGGRALAMNGAVTLDSNVITPPSPACVFGAAPTPTPTPAPTTVATPLATPVATPTVSPSATAGSSAPSPSASANAAATIPPAGSPSPASSGTGSPTGLAPAPTFRTPGISLIPGLPNTSLPLGVSGPLTAAALSAIGGGLVLGVAFALAASRRRRAVPSA